jgi:4-hydroxy-tetrahydrodipicolinate synthase
VGTPYYNKASSEGLVAHFTAIADSVSIPIILYNVPSRTGVDIPLGVYEKLAAHKRIVALKEARGNTDTVKLLRSEGIPLTVYSGDDRLLCEMLDCGALGCISASSNVIPRQMADICKLYFSGDVEAARGLEASLSELYDAMFCQVNPIPVKHAMSLMGLCGNEMRLPLCPPSERFAESIKSVLMKYGLIS